MDRYYGSIFEEGGTGAILMAVCRGRISEGLNFSDNAARCVIVVGIPYPQMTDPRVMLKQNYLDHIPSQNRMLSGRDWYN